MSRATQDSIHNIADRLEATVRHGVITGGEDYEKTVAEQQVINAAKFIRELKAENRQLREGINKVKVNLMECVDREGDLIPEGDFIANGIVGAVVFLDDLLSPKTAQVLEGEGITEEEYQLRHANPYDLNDKYVRRLRK